MSNSLLVYVKQEEDEKDMEHHYLISYLVDFPNW